MKRWTVSLILNGEEERDDISISLYCNKNTSVTVISAKLGDSNAVKKMGFLIDRLLQEVLLPMESLEFREGVGAEVFESGRYLSSPESEADTHSAGDRGSPGS